MKFLRIWTNLFYLHLGFSIELTFPLQEEVPAGTVVATSSDLAPLNTNPETLPFIINKISPGASSFGFIKRPHSGLELVVTGRVDRETICPAKGSSSISAGLQPESAPRPSFRIEDPSRSSAYRHQFGRYDLTTSNFPHAGCDVALRVASGDKIFNVKVEILDINDNAPTWNISVLNLSLRDGDAEGTIIYLPLAEDDDAGPNGEVVYSLQDGHEDTNDGGYVNGRRSSGSQVRLFELIKHPEITSSLRNQAPVPSLQHSEQKLVLRTTTPIDREQSPEIIRLLLVAKDSGSPTPQQNSLKLVINITDVNDNAPMFERTIHKIDTLSEDAAVGKTLLQLYAKDMDSGPNAEITYRFEDNGQLSMDVIRHFFEITPSGKLKILRRLNVDKIEGELNLPSSIPISFGVEAVDGASPAYALTGRTTIQLQVSDTNDEAPRIQVYPVYPPKQSPPGTLNAVETTAQENGGTGQLLALVEVMDPDLEGLGTVDCHLKGTFADYFQLISTSAVSGKVEYSLMTNARLDRESNPRLEVSIICRDLADHVSRQDVGVSLVDVNDNAPKFDKPFYEFFIEENDGEAEVEDSSVSVNSRRPVRGQAGEAGVLARDLDSGENSKISYHLESDPRDQASMSYFSIDQNTGALFAVASLDRESKTQHRFIVVAFDRGEPMMSASTEVLVHVENLNDNVPQFINQILPEVGYSFSVDENNSPGRFVGQVVALDVDDDYDDTHESSQGWVLTGSYGASSSGRHPPLQPTSRLIYTMGSEKDASAFRIDKYSGNITTRERLDRETQSTYTFQVYVSDGVHPEGSVESSLQRWTPPNSRIHTTATTVVVNVRDLNDNRPTFLQPNATNHLILLDPTTMPGRSLMQIIATDPDEGENGKVTFSIVDGNVGGVFFVAPVEGLLYLNGQIPRRLIEKAIYTSTGSAVPVARGAVDLDLKQSEVGWQTDGAVAAVTKGDAVDSSLHPTYVLKLEACDSGSPKQCSYFPNLQIQLFVPSEHNTGSSVGGSYGDRRSTSSEKGERFTWGRNSIVEQVTIGLTVFFAVIVLVALLVVFLMRGGGGIRSCAFGGSRKEKDVEKLKHTANVGLIGEPKLHPSCSSGEYLTNTSAGLVNVETPFVNLRHGAWVLPATTPFSPVPQTMMDCPTYRDGYQMGGKPLVYPPTQSMQTSASYGVLGPSTLVGNRPMMTTLPPHYRQDDYQCLDTPINATANLVQPCETNWQATQSIGSGCWNPHIQTTTTAWSSHNNNNTRRHIHEFGGSVDVADDIEEEEDRASASLELLKHPFMEEGEKEIDTHIPPTLSNTNSSILSRSKTLNFPEATFV